MADAIYYLSESLMEMAKVIKALAQQKEISA